MGSNNSYIGLEVVRKAMKYLIHNRQLPVQIQTDVSPLHMYWHL